MVKHTTEVFDIHGRKVEITRVPPRTRLLAVLGEPVEKAQEQSLFDLRVDGAYVALVKRLFGKGKRPFKLERLIEGFSVSGIGERDVYIPADQWLFTLEDVAAKAVELRNSVTRGVSSLPTADELQAYLMQEAEQRKIERAERTARDELEKEDRIAERAAEAEAFDDLVGGLKSIEERLGGQLTNYEMNALRIVIAKQEKDRETVLHQRMIFESDEFKGR